MEIVQEFLKELAIISVPLIMFFVSHGLNYLKLYLQDKAKNETLNKYFNDVIEAVKDAVYITAQDYTSDLKKEQGYLTLEQQAIALNKAKDKFIELMGEEVQDLVFEIHGDFDEWFKLKVDSILGSSKL